MSEYEIFDILYTEFRKETGDENSVFTQKFMVSKQYIRIHCVKNKKTGFRKLSRFFK